MKLSEARKREITAEARSAIATTIRILSMARGRMETTDPMNEFHRLMILELFAHYDSWKDENIVNRSQWEARLREIIADGPRDSAGNTPATPHDGGVGGDDGPEPGPQTPQNQPEAS